jgi:single-stranded DNA-specific DHH superfamily exonuclease
VNPLKPEKVTRQKKRDLNELFEKGADFLRNLKPTDKIALMYHMDMDGVCSAALVHLFLKKISAVSGGAIKISKSSVSTYRELEYDFKPLSGCNKIIILDIGIDNPFWGEREALVVDHHIVKTDFNSKSTVFINPRFEDEEIYQPASYVTYKLLSGIVDMSESKWIAAIGIVSDHGYRDCMDILGDCIKAKGEKNVSDSDVSITGEVLVGASYELGFDKVLNSLIDAKGIGDLKSDKKLSGAYKKYEVALNDGKRQFWANAEALGNVIFSTIRPKYKRLSSPVINHISSENPDKAMFIFEESDDELKVSARYQDADSKRKVHLGEIMTACCDGGGHRAAAGGSITEFKKCILRELRGKL